MALEKLIGVETLGCFKGVLIVAEKGVDIRRVCAVGNITRRNIYSACIQDDFMMFL